MASKPHACDRVLSLALHPWAITRPMLGVVAHVLGHRLAGDALDTSTLEKRPPADPSTEGGVAVIPIHGVIAPRMNAFSDISGAATFEQAGLALDEAMAHAGVTTIVLDVDSPGGSVLGASEFARRVMAARVTKRIIACANYEMCSAAYWFGACASEIVAAPSAMVGSIGVYTLHKDLSAALEQLGVKLTYVSAGKYKVDGIQGEPLTESALARLTAIVDAHYTRFVGDVAKGRGITDDAVRNGYGEGSILTAEEALATGMIDRVATFEEVLTRLIPASNSPAHLPGARATAPAPPADTPQEPPKVTGHDRAREVREAESALLGLSF